MGLWLVMRFDEEFNRNIWNVLQKIRTNCTQDTNRSFGYTINLLHNSVELEILKKLEAWNAIHIHDKHLLVNLCVSVSITLLPIFSEIYREVVQVLAR